MSIMAFCSPAMCSVVTGDALVICRHRDNARMSCMTTGDVLAAIHCNQWTLGLLLLYQATCLSCKSPATSEMMRKRRRIAARLRSEFVLLPCGFCAKVISCCITIHHRGECQALHKYHPTYTMLGGIDNSKNVCPQGWYTLLAKTWTCIRRCNIPGWQSSVLHCEGEKLQVVLYSGCCRTVT